MDYNTHLQHYGVLGMKWGVRKQESTSGKANNKEAWALTDKQKKLIKIGLIVAGTGLAIYGGYKLAGYLKPATEMVTSHFEDYVPAPPEKRAVLSDELKAKIGDINPHFTRDISDPNYIASHSNCGNCVIAEELRMRGQKVFAKLSPTGLTPGQLGAYFQLKPDSISTFDLGELGEAKNFTGKELSGFYNDARGEKVQAAIENHILKALPKGSRGALALPGTYVNHFLSFEHLGDTVRLDNPQDPEKYLRPFFNQVISSGTSTADSGGGIKLIRLDNLKTNAANLQEVVTSSIDDLSTAVGNSILKGSNFVMKKYN